MCHYATEKLQHLQKEAVKIQINLDTEALNKIEALRNCYRKAAMQDFEEWRSNAEMPIFQNISGKMQENRKAYRYYIILKKDMRIFQNIVTIKDILESMSKEQYC